jgi:hypothetical protein
VPADVTYLDLPAPPPTEGATANDLPADALARLRNADALLHVVRAFDDPAVPHPSGGIDPIEPRHAYVHDDHIRFKLARKPEDVLPIHRLAQFKAKGLQ